MRVRVYYREAGPPDAPTMLLLHGFPSASHQYRRLIDALGGRYRMITPDYPGFGHSDAPGSATTGGTFAYTFDRLADVIEGFCGAKGAFAEKGEGRQESEHERGDGGRR